MRTKNVKFSMELPVRFNEPDCNGVIYTKESWEEAIKSAKGMPIEIINNDGSSTVIGVLENITMDCDNNVFIQVEGIKNILWHGVTSEDVVFTKDKITNMGIKGVRITK